MQANARENCLEKDLRKHGIAPRLTPIRKSRYMKSTWRQTLFATILFGGTAGAFAAIVIDFADTQQVASYSQAQMDSIGQLKWFFSHASVGDNIMAGIDSLHSGNPGFYQLTHAYYNPDNAPHGKSSA
jgi:hypothetical protein